MWRKQSARACSPPVVEVECLVELGFRFATAGGTHAETERGVIDQLLNRIMQMIFEWVEADRGCIMLLDEQSKALSPKVRHHRQGFAASAAIATTAATIAQRPLRTAQV